MAKHGVEVVTDSSPGSDATVQLSANFDDDADNFSTRQEAPSAQNLPDSPRSWQSASEEAVDSTQFTNPESVAAVSHCVDRGLAFAHEALGDVSLLAMEPDLGSGAEYSKGSGATSAPLGVVGKKLGIIVKGLPIGTNAYKDKAPDDVDLNGLVHAASSDEVDLRTDETASEASHTDEHESTELGTSGSSSASADARSAAGDDFGGEPVEANGSRLSDVHIKETTATELEPNQKRGNDGAGGPEYERFDPPYVHFDVSDGDTEDFESDILDAAEYTTPLARYEDDVSSSSVDVDYAYVDSVHSSDPNYADDDYDYGHGGAAAGGGDAATAGTVSNSVLPSKLGDSAVKSKDSIKRGLFDSDSDADCGEATDGRPDMSSTDAGTNAALGVDVGGSGPTDVVSAKGGDSSAGAGLESGGVAAADVSDSKDRNVFVQGQNESPLFNVDAGNKANVDADSGGSSVIDVDAGKAEVKVTPTTQTSRAESTEQSECNKTASKPEPAFPRRNPTEAVSLDGIGSMLLADTALSEVDGKVLHLIGVEAPSSALPVRDKEVNGYVLSSKGTLANDAAIDRTKEVIVEVAAVESASTDKSRGIGAAVDSDDRQMDEDESPVAGAVVSQVSRRDVELYVGDAEKYRMWSVNPETGDHEFDPGPLAVDFYCNACQRSLPLGTFRIRCVECVDFDLCVPCACRGTERSDHHSDHKYIPIAPNSFKLFGEWTADAELLLLEGISKFGFGNWNQVAEMVNRRSVKNKSAADCENHYNEYYIRSTFSPFPDIGKIRTPINSKRATERLRSFFDFVYKSHREDKPRKRGDYCITDERLHHVELIPPDVRVLATAGIRLKFFHNFNGYNIYRDEFDVEHNNDAESIIKDLEFDPWDTPAEIEFKLRLVEIYNSMLDDRIRRKRILMHRFWYDYPTRETGLQSMNHIEKAAYWRLSPLMRLHTEEEHIRLTRLIVARVEIEKRLRLVGTWFSLGLYSLDDVEKFELQRFPSAHASCRDIELRPTARCLVNTGSVSDMTIYAFSEQMCLKFCHELSLSNEQLEALFTKISKFRTGGQVVINGNLSVVPTWDLCFNNGELEEQNEPPTHLPPLTLQQLPDFHWFPRVVVEEGDAPEFPFVDFRGIHFSSVPSSEIQQSHAFPGVKSCLYVAKFVPLPKVRVRKYAPKRKRLLSINEPTKRGNTRK
ncbi:ADA2-A transcriptional co-activator SAGA component [Babesia caballi]|uniref:ADA2-A transcriptional co-activator SAGA component n=1 Tax=Babesia caballi TaxID=5871 RepID=A0AAV4M0E1_BABCB|nr:ADA2-A transcriptional co-activator SAGA component [Babesia caballi]